MKFALSVRLAAKAGVSAVNAANAAKADVSVANAVIVVETAVATSAKATWPPAMPTPLQAK